MPGAEFGDWTQADARDALVAVVVDWIEENLDLEEIRSMNKTEAHLIATKVVVDGYVAATVDGDDSLSSLYAKAIIEKSKNGMVERANWLVTDIKRRAWNEVKRFRLDMAA